jgi:hypothetical protein
VDFTLILLRPSNVIPVLHFIVLFVALIILCNAPPVWLEPTSTMLLKPASAVMVSLLTKLLANSVPISAKIAVLLMQLALPVLTLFTEISLKIANVLMGTMIQAQSTVLLAQLLATPAPTPLLVPHAIQPSSEISQALSVRV